MDLDLKAVLLSTEDKVIECVDFSHLASANEAVKHSGDNRSGEGDGDDETVVINVNTLPEDVDSVVFLIAAFGSASFANVSKLTASLYAGQGEGISKLGAYEVKGQEGVQVVLMARLFRENGMFKFSALGEAAASSDVASLLPLVEKSVADKKPKSTPLELGQTLIFSGPEQVMVGAGWETEGKVDLDLYSVLMDKKSKAVELVNYSNLKSDNESVQHGGDNRAGTGAGDDEHIMVSLEDVPEKITTLTFPITAYGGNENWKRVTSMYIRLVDVSVPTAPRELARYALDTVPEGEYTALLAATLSRHSSGGWAFGAAGEPIVEREVKDEKTLAKALKDKMRNKAKGPESVALGVHDSITTDPRAVKVACGWQAKSKKADLDLKALLLGPSGFIVEEVDYSHLTSGDSNVSHSGDDRTGAGDGDDEVVSLNLPGLGPEIESVLFVVANYNGSLADAKSVFVRLLDDGGEEPVELARHDMNVDSDDKALMVAELARIPHSPRWSFTILAKPVTALRNADVASSLAREKVGVQLTSGDVGTLEPPSETFVGMTWKSVSALTQSQADAGFELTPFAVLINGNGDTSIVSAATPESDDGGVKFYTETPYDRHDAAGHYIKFPQIDSTVHDVVFGLAHFDPHGFSQIDSIRARISDVEGGVVQEIGRYSVAASGDHSAVLLIKMSRDSAHPGTWTVKALGAPANAASEAELGAAVVDYMAAEDSDVMVLQPSKVARLVAPQKLAFGFSWPTTDAELSAGCYSLDAKGSLEKKIDHDKAATKDGSIAIASGLKAADPSARDNDVVTVNFPELPPKVTQLLFVVTTKFAKKSDMRAVGEGVVRVSDGNSPDGEVLLRMEGGEMTGMHNSFVMLWLTRETADVDNWIVNAIARPMTASKQKDLVKKFVAEQAAIEAADRKTTELNAGQVATINAADLLRVGVGWDAGKKLLGLIKKGADLDLVAVSVNEAGAQVGDVVSYKNLQSADGALVHQGDDTDGKGEGENESIIVDLTKISPAVQAIVFVITAYSVSFKNIKSCFLAVSDEAEMNAPPFAITEADCGDTTAMIMASIFRSGGSWKIKAMGAPSNATDHSAIVESLAAAAAAPRSLKMRKNDQLQFEGTDKVTLGVGWTSRSGDAVDLDLHAMVFNADGEHVESCSYSTPEVCAGAVKHGGDNRSGEGEGDDEQVHMDLSGIPADVQSIVFLLSAYGRASFGLIKSMYARLLNTNTEEGPDANRELAKFKLKLREGNTYAAVAVCVVSRSADSPSGWVVEAAGITADGVDQESVLPLIQAHVKGEPELPETLTVTPGDWVSMSGSSSINLGLGWTAGEATDLDASILIYSAKQKLTQAVYHQNLQGKISLDKVPEEGREGLVADDDGKVVIIQHSGDEREGDAEGDDESISINLKAFPPKWNRAVIVVSVYGNTFKTVEDASITVSDTSRGAHLPHELIRMDLTLPEGDRENYTGLVVGEIYRDPSSDAWVFLARGNKVYCPDGLQQLADLIKAKIIIPQDADQ